MVSQVRVALRDPFHIADPSFAYQAPKPCNAIDARSSSTWVAFNLHSSQNHHEVTVGLVLPVQEDTKKK